MCKVEIDVAEAPGEKTVGIDLGINNFAALAYEDGHSDCIREDEENGSSKNWDKHGNLDLHSWPFNRFTDLLTYKAEMEGITVEQVSECETSESCSCCGRTRKANRVERGLYVCDECGTVANADVNGAENVRQKVSPSLACDEGDRSNGWLAQPSTYLFDQESGCFAPRERATW